MRRATHRIEGKGMKANATDLRYALNGMTPEQICDASAVEEIKMLQRPDGLADGDAGAIG